MLPQEGLHHGGARGLAHAAKIQPAVANLDFQFYRVRVRPQGRASPRGGTEVHGVRLTLRRIPASSCQSRLPGFKARVQPHGRASPRGTEVHGVWLTLRRFSRQLLISTSSFIRPGCDRREGLNHGGHGGARGVAHAARGFTTGARRCTGCFSFLRGPIVLARP